MFAVDPGTHFKGNFGKMCISLGIPLKKSGTEAHWEGGQTEVEGKVWKAAFDKAVHKHQVSLDDWQKVFLTCAGVNRARNNRTIHKGHSPAQWVLGSGVSLPSSLVDNSENVSSGNCGLWPRLVSGSTGSAVDMRRRVREGR